MIGNTVGPHEQEFLNRQAKNASGIASFALKAEQADEFLANLDAMLSTAETPAVVIEHKTLSAPAVSTLLSGVFPNFKHV